MPQLRNSDDSFGVVSKLFHWVMAVLIIGMLILGNVMEDMQGPDKLQAYGIHKSTGIIVLFLVFLRLTWRQANKVPKLPPDFPKLLKFGADASHFTIYFLMFAMPISGWMMSSAAGFPVSVYGWFTMPMVIESDRELRGALNQFHGIAANVLIALLLAHIGAALFHHFVRKDNVLRRMLPLVALMMAMPAAASDFAVDKADSKIEFTAVQNNAPVKGEFKTYEAEIKFSPDDLAGSKVKFVFSIDGIFTDYEDVAASLKTAEWFDANKFPQAVFESGSFTRLEGNKYKGEGNLTIRDVTKPATISFTLDEYSEQKAKVTGEAALKRNDFGVGQGEWKDTGSVKDEVAINFVIKATAK